MFSSFSVGGYRSTRIKGKTGVALPQLNVYKAISEKNNSRDLRGSTP